MAENDYDPAGSTQMFRAFVEEQNPAPQAAPGNVTTYGTSNNNGGRTGLIVGVTVVALAVLAGVVWLAVG